MKQRTKTRKAVCAMANELRKAGHSLFQAFKKASSRVKLSMTIRAAGTTFENRQERLGFLKLSFKNVIRRIHDKILWAILS